MCTVWAPQPGTLKSHSTEEKNFKDFEIGEKNRAWTNQLQYVEHPKQKAGRGGLRQINTCCKDKFFKMTTFCFGVYKVN